MRSHSLSFGITHSLTPLLQTPPPFHYDIPEPAINHSPTIKQTIYHNNMHHQRSRKHRMAEQKNTQIERQNRRLYQKIRKIKMKNTFQSEPKIQTTLNIQRQNDLRVTLSKPINLPQVNHHQHTSLNSTKSQLTSLLSDRKTFVSKYFEDLGHLKGKAGRLTEQLGTVMVHGWRVKVLLLDKQFVMLRGHKHGKELTKKYLWQKVKQKVQSNMEDWVKIKFQFQD